MDLGFPISAQIGVFVGLLGPCGSRRARRLGREVVTAHPEMAFWRQPVGELGTGPDGGERARRVHRVGPSGGGDGHGEVVDSTAEEVHS